MVMNRLVLLVQWVVISNWMVLFYKWMCTTCTLNTVNSDVLSVKYSIFCWYYRTGCDFFTAWYTTPYDQRYIYIERWMSPVPDEAYYSNLIYSSIESGQCVYLTLTILAFIRMPQTLAVADDIENWPENRCT